MQEKNVTGILVDVAKFTDTKEKVGLYKEPKWKKVGSGLNTKMFNGKKFSDFEQSQIRRIALDHIL